MAKRVPLLIGGQAFKTKSAAQAAIRKVLYEAKAGQPLVGRQKQFICDLLERHPRRHEKVGAGVAEVVVRVNRTYGRATRGFWVQRVDGTEIDFSYLECLSPSSHRTKVLCAMRHAVSDQCQRYKTEYFGDHSGVCCEETGQPIEWANCHVDHVPPKTFAVIADSFLANVGLSFDDVEITTATFGDRLVSDAIRDQWADWHQQHATLKCVLDSVNLSRPKILDLPTGICR